MGYAVYCILSMTYLLLRYGSVGVMYRKENCSAGGKYKYIFSFSLRR